jgi:hypothetical protein
VLVLTLTHQAFAWGNLGHQAIGEASQGVLSAKAQEGLGKVFGHGAALAPGTLAKVATWPDEIWNRMGHGAVPATWDKTDIDEADKFNQNPQAQRLWHFVNLPLDASGYPGVGRPLTTLCASSPDPTTSCRRGSGVSRSFNEGRKSQRHCERGREAEKCGLDPDRRRATARWRSSRTGLHCGCGVWAVRAAESSGPP